MKIGRSISPQSDALRNSARRSTGLPSASSQRAFLQPARISTSASCSSTRAMRSGCAIGDADLAFDHRDPVERLAPMLIGQLELTEALTRKIEGAVNAPQLVPLLGCRSGLWDRRCVDDPDQAAAARLRRGGGQRLPDQERQPVAAPA